MEVIEEQPRRRSQRSARVQARQQREQQLLQQQQQQQQAQQQQQQQAQNQQPVEEEKEQRHHHQQQQQQNQHQNQRQQQQQQQTMNFGEQRFLAKIPNSKVLREFLVNSAGYYAPPQRDLTNDFCRKLLAGEKKLLKYKDVIFVSNVPNWPEFSSKHLWLKAKSNPNLALYFPDFAISRCPQRKYLLNVANTVSQNSVIKAVNDIRQKRENEGIEDKPIVVTNEFAHLLSQFVSITSDQRRGGLRLGKKKERDQCCLCLQPMIEGSKTIANFNCLRHKSHRKCIAKYLRSDIGKNSDYLCPQRCSEVWNR